MVAIPPPENGDRIMGIYLVQVPVDARFLLSPYIIGGESYAGPAHSGALLVGQIG